jgi:hypothetical protein
VGLCGIIILQFVAAIELLCVGVCLKKGKKSEETETLTQTVVVVKKEEDPKKSTAWSNRRSSQYTEEDLRSLKIEMEPTKTTPHSQSGSYKESTNIPPARSPVNDELASRYSGAAYNELNSTSSANNANLNSRYSGSSYGGSW